MRSTVSQFVLALAGIAALVALTIFGHLSADVSLPAIVAIIAGGGGYQAGKISASPSGGA